MVSLIQQLQNDILDPKTSLNTILRRAKVLASTLRNEEFKKWLDNELDGYRDRSAVPDYRRSHGENRGNFVSSLGSSAKNLLIPLSCLPGSSRNYYEEAVIHQGVGALQHLIESDPTNSTLRIMWPVDLVASVASDIYQGYHCISAWQVLSHAQLAQA
jgi:hypothetical protein